MDAARLHLQVQVIERPEASEVLDQAPNTHRRMRTGFDIEGLDGRGFGSGCHSTGSSPAERRMVAAKSGSASMSSISSATKAC